MKQTKKILPYIVAACVCTAAASTLAILSLKKKTAPSPAPNKTEQAEERDDLLHQDTPSLRELLDKKRKDEFKLRCSITQAIDQLVLTRNSDSIDYILEKTENVIQLLNSACEE